MPANYVDTPATEKGDETSMLNQHMDFSFAQPFASPSKNPAEDLRNQMKGLRGGVQPLKTPRTRTPLVSKRNSNGMQKQEFTPLLKSAKRNQLLQQSMLEEKENGVTGVPEMPDAFHSSYASRTPALPVNSSMLDPDHTGSSANGSGGATPVPPVQSSSMLDSTPMPQLPRNGEAGVLDQGNVLTLRDQEQKLDQIQKDNFGLKLKIHYLEEALRKTGTTFQQATLKENVELKTAKMTIEADLKRQRKRLQTAEVELEEYRQKFKEYQETVRKRHMTERDSEELERFQKMAEESQKVADEREQELDAMRQKLEEAEQSGQESDEVQRLKDDVQDLEAEIRDRERQLDEKDVQLEDLQDKLQSAEAETPQADHLQQDIDELEAELKEKDQKLEAKTGRIVDLEERVNSAYDREKSTKKLRGDVVELENQLRERDEQLDEASEQRRAFEKRLQAAQAASAAEIRQRDDEVRNAQRELADKDGEIKALQERLQTARGSWDAEAQETDARLQDKDRQIQEKDSRLREKSRVIEERDEELLGLQKRLRAAENSQDDLARQQSQQIREQGEKIRELQEKLRVANATSQAKLNEKDGLIQARESELQAFQNRLSHLQSGESAETRAKNERNRDLEAFAKEREGTIRDQLEQITSLQAQLGAMETPSKKDSLIKEQVEHVRSLQQQLQKLEQDKDEELDELEQQLQILESKNAELEKKHEGLTRKAETMDRDHSLIGHQDVKLKGKQDRVDALEEDLDELQAKLRKAVEQRQADIKALEQELDDAKAASSSEVQEAQQQLYQQKAELQAEHADVRQGLEDEILVLEAGLDEAQGEKAALETRIFELEEEVQSSRRLRDNGTPARERKDLRLKLKTAENECNVLKATIKELERELAFAQQEKTIAEERKDLHDLLKQAKIEAEELQIQLSERDRKLLAGARKDGELRGQLQSAQMDVEDLQAQVTELQRQMQTSLSKEKEFRVQLRELQGAKAQLEDLEGQLGERKSSSSGHARREPELRTQLREAKIEVESLQIEVAELQSLQAAGESDRTLDGKQWDARLVAAEKKKHEGELKGLVKQIQYLRAKCSREESFRSDLVFVKKWFVMQVKMYHQCNQADLRLLEEMGITPDISFRQNRHSLRTVGFAVIACARMQKMREAWAGSKKVQESLLRKLEGMRAAKRKGLVG